MKISEGEKVADVLASSFAQPNIEEQKLVYLQKFIDECKDNNIELVMCYSPYYGQPIPKSFRMIEELVEKNGVNFLNYGDDICFQNPEYFQDASHLNDTGARVYSNAISSVIRIMLH